MRQLTQSEIDERIHVDEAMRRYHQFEQEREDRKQLWIGFRNALVIIVVGAGLLYLAVVVILGL